MSVKNIKLLAMRTRDIVFTLLFGDERYTIETYQGEYRNLMQLISDRIFIEDFGECKGMGRCATCMVTITNRKSKAPVKAIDEAATLHKEGKDNDSVRLSCQMLITENLVNATVSIG